MTHPFKRTPPTGYLLEPAEYAGYWVRIQVDGVEISFLVGEFEDATRLMEALQGTASISVKKVQE